LLPSLEGREDVEGAIADEERLSAEIVVEMSRVTARGDRVPPRLHPRLPRWLGGTVTIGALRLVVLEEALDGLECALPAEA
jgi:hypothetical protein|tara:strand:- start:405 stop:647 length:243 start_codon:yes stop_codon:yes gene_type:complete